MRGPREVLNEMRWREGALGDAVVRYVHRGAPGDERAVRGADVVELGRSFFGVRDARTPGGVSMIPYHRVFRIERRDGSPVWDRRDREGQREGASAPKRDTPSRSRAHRGGS